MASPIAFDPGTLWSLIARQSTLALERGALHPIGTEYRFIEQDGVRFVVRAASNLMRKSQDQPRSTNKVPRSSERPNPFLSYDPDLFVADISPSHICLLNKFNVIDCHVLVVTRAFEHQETLLTLADFEALCRCMAEFDSIGFYNGGTEAGASQPHKHLQIVPLPLVEDCPAIPVEAIIDKSVSGQSRLEHLALPFRHAFMRLDPSLRRRPVVAAAAAHESYCAAVNHLAIGPADFDRRARQSTSYNLLVTFGWMLVVPRSQETFRSISVNGLGFAGSLFVRDQRQIDTIQHDGPMTILRRVALDP